MNPGIALLAGVCLAGWFVAAVMIGLYVGERGRRKDAQRREGVLKVDGPPLAAVHVPGETRSARKGQILTASKTAPLLDELTDARDAYVAKAVRDGFTEKEARADFDRMMANAATDDIGAPKMVNLG